MAHQTKRFKGTKRVLYNFVTNQTKHLKNVIIKFNIDEINVLFVEQEFHLRDHVG